MSNREPRFRRMPRAWSLAVMLGAATVLAPSRASAAPKLSMPTLRQDLGELTAGETAEAEFPICNTGTGTDAEGGGTRIETPECLQQLL
jgi:hypothetical protein